MTTILTAAPVIEQAIENLTKRCQKLAAEKKVIPTMKVILVGKHAPSLIYTRNKKKFCERFGANCDILHFPEELKEKEFLKEVEKVAKDPNVHGCFVQLPLPKHLSHIDVGNLIPSHKDVDGFSDGNIYALFKGDIGEKSLIPCTPKGIITLLDHYNIPVHGKNIVIIGRSHIVGRPLSLLLTNLDATVTLCHSKTKNLSTHTKQADIIIAAIGKARFINRSHLDSKRKYVIIDVGMNHDEHGKLCGDVDFEDVKNLSQAITPVPGGIGPMTILSLSQNLLQAAEKGLYH